MRRREAEGVCPTIESLRQDWSLETAMFEPVVVAVENVVPRVEVVRPGLLMLPVEGALRFYGGEREVLDAVVAAINQTGSNNARYGLASGPFAAMQAAMQAEIEPLVVTNDEYFRSQLDIDAIGVEEIAATFRWLGITTLGELARLPRAMVASRFGPAGLEAHRLASGEDRTVRPRPHPDDLAVEKKMEEPLANLEQAGFLARALSNELIARLTDLGTAPHRVEIEAEAADGSIMQRTWRSTDPMNEAALVERIRWQLHAWVERGGARGGLVRLRLTPEDLSGEGRQLALDEDPITRQRAEKALLRTQALVGMDGVLQARSQGGRTPGEQVQWFRWGDEAGEPQRDPASPWPGRVPSPAPALIPPANTSIEVEWEDGTPARVRLRSRWVPVVSWAGPWRYTGRWWEGEESNDRYQIVTSAGAFLCEVRSGLAYLIGVYD